MSFIGLNQCRKCGKALDRNCPTSWCEECIEKEAERRKEKLQTKQMTPEDIERHEDYFGNYELKPCPFCGCEMECRLMHDRETDGFPMRYFIVGDHEWGCFLMHVSMVSYDDKEKAISTWNRRVKE